MSMRFLVRGTTAAACAAFAATAVLSPVHAAVPAAPVAASAFGQLAAAPTSPVIPSKDDIAKAKKSEAATAAESAKIEAILASANDRLQGSMAGTIAANNTYTNAAVALDKRRAEADTAKAKAGAAAKEYQSAKAQLGQIAGTLYKNGGVNLSVQAFLGSSSADETMYQASTLMVLSNERATTYDSASAASSTSTALQEQASAAQTAADQAATTAAESKNAAQAATDALAAVVKENQSQRTVLLQQLATLHNTTAALEGARVDGLARQAQEEALAAQIAASAKISTPVAPPPVADSPAQPAQPPAAVQPGNPPAQPVAPPVQPVHPVQPVQPPAAPKPPVVPVKPTPPPVVAPPPTQPSGSYVQVMVNYAIAQSGGAYQWGGTGNPGFDCSGLVMKAFAAAGVNVPRTGTDQFWAAPTHVPLSQMRYGDLLVFDETSPGSGQFGHIAIYVGNGQVMQALAPGYPTGVSSISGMLQVGMKLYSSVARY